MSNKNPYAEAESSIDIGFGEVLPPVCIACGATATGFKTIVYEQPNSTTESIVRVLARMVFGRRHMVEENRRSYLIPLPVCELHGQYDGALNDVALFPHRGRSVVVHPVCNDFILALRAHRQAQANAFNSALANNQPSDAKDFLKSLEQE